MAKSHNPAATYRAAAQAPAVFTTVRTQEITFTAQPQRPGSSRIVYNVDVNGRAWGQVWTFKVPGETHPWHVGDLNHFHDVRGSKAAAFALAQDRIATYY